MAENTSASASTLIACDRCYARKTKCDKGDPCKNCVASSTTCRRNRQMVRRRKPRTADRIRILTERMHEIEGLLHPDQAQSENAPPPLIAPATSSGDANIISYIGSSSEQNSLHHDRGSSDSLGSNVTGKGAARLPYFQISSQETHSQRQSDQNDAATFPELAPPNTLFKQWEALEKSLIALNQICRTSSIEDWISYGEIRDEENVCGLTPSDIVNVVTASSEHFCLKWSNSMLARPSKTTMEKIGQSLLEGRGLNDQKALQYNIIINFQSALLLDRQGKRSESGSDIHIHIERIKHQKLLKVLRCLDAIHFRTPPSLSLLRAQCIGVVILQYMGSIPEAYSMMRAVSHTLVGLGYDAASSGHITTTELSFAEIEDCIDWCYQLDRSMSLLLQRPPLFSRQSRPPASRLPSCDFAIPDSVDINLQLAHIQEKTYVMGAGPAEVDWNQVDPLYKELLALFSRIDNMKLKASRTQAKEHENDFSFIEFKCYATQVILLQIPVDIARSSQLQSQLATSARKSFEYLSKLVRNDSKIDLVDISWDILLYSLSPLCVVTHGIIYNRDRRDLELIEEYAAFVRHRILKTTPSNPLAERLHELCVSIIDICNELFSPATTTTTSNINHNNDKNTTAIPVQRRPRTNAYPTNHTPRRKNFMNFEHFFTGNIGPLPNNSEPHTMAESGASGQEEDMERSQDEDKFLKLLTYRPKIDWIYPAI